MPFCFRSPLRPDPRINNIGFTPIANVSVNGKKLALDVAAVIEDDRVLVPMRAIFEELVASVAWDDVTQTVLITT